MTEIVNRFDAVPTWLLFGLFIAIGVALTLAADILVHKRVAQEKRERAGASTAAMVQVLAEYGGAVHVSEQPLKTGLLAPAAR